MLCRKKQHDVYSTTMGWCILQEILQSHFFLKSRTQGGQSYEVKWIKSIFTDKGIVLEQSLGHLFITSSSSRIFNKTNFEQSF